MSVVNQMLGAPFKEGGRDLRGIDCLGVVLMVMRDLSVPFVDLWALAQTTPQEEWSDRLNDELGEDWRMVFPPLNNGDLILIPGHVAVFVDGYVVSAAERVGVYRVSWDRFRKEHRWVEVRRRVA